MEKILGKLYNLWKIYFTSFFCFLTIILALNLFLNSIFNQTMVAITFIVSFLIGRLIIDRNYKNLALTLISLVLISLVWYWLFYFIRDVSSDGNTYHLEAIIRIFDGISIYFDTFKSSRLNFYPKTMEILFSWFAAFFKNYDMWRIFKIFLILLSFINVIYVIRKTAKHKLKWRHFLLIAIVVLNPVVIYQFFTIYIDDILYLLLVNFFIYFFLWETKIALFIFAIMISSKISYVLFGGLGFISMIRIYSIYHNISLSDTIKKHYRNIWSTHAIKIILLIIIFAVWCHQYLINTYKYHNPLYWFAWTSKIDIIWKFQPPIMRDENKISKFTYTFFSYSRNFCVRDECQEFISLKNKDDIKKFFKSYNALWFYDPNLNGFGNIYSILLIISIVYLIYFIYLTIFTRLPNKYKKNKRTKLQKIWFILGIYTLLCTFLLPFPRARYFPLLYLLPIIITFLQDNKILNHLTKWILIIYTINLLLVLWVITSAYWKQWQHKINQQDIVNQLTFNEIHYTTFRDGSYMYVKYFWFYDKQMEAIPKTQTDKQTLLKLCGILEYSQIATNYNHTINCPNGWTIMKWDAQSTVEEFFYLH